ncbi:hypothetical protein AX15_004130 [Amanita polypyramis BW_CC]|nr:hypothetical protein AX15_004130 [Amanita polypyramis BW_CC]
MLNLGAGLAGHLFPRYFSRALQDDLRQWIQKTSVAAFDSEIPLATRWSNLVLLAVYNKPHGSQPTDDPSNADLKPESIEWRTALVLSTLEQAFSKSALAVKAQMLASILNPLWRMWSDSDFDRPLVVSQAFLTSFLGLAGIAKDRKLFEACARYAMLRELWSVLTGGSENRAMHVLASYLAGLVQCQDKKWSHIFQVLDEATLTDIQRAHVTSLLLQRFIEHDIVMALEFYRICRRRGVSVSTSDTHRIAMSLAASHHLQEAISLLSTPGFSPDHVEILLGEILHTFQATRLEVIESYLAAEIGGVMETLYAQRKPMERLKYPIRLFLSIMVSSGQPSKAVNVIESVVRTSPSFFTARIFARLIQSLLRRREFKHAVRVLRIAQRTTPSRSIDITRDKLITRLANVGASRLAQGLYQDHCRLNPQLSMLRVAVFRIRNPTAYATLRILRVLSQMPPNEQTIKYVVTLLVQARRLYAARKLVQAKCENLTPESITVVGNTILHGLLLHRRQRNGRLVAHLLSIKTLLEQTCRFTPDRLTTNIIIEAILRWHTVVDTSQVKSLFDRIIRLGYPAGSRRCQQHGAVFGTPPTSSQNVELSVFTSPLSFRKHVKPLYKTFIKAFYLRGDVNAAKIVIGILKEETAKAMQERERRERARRQGIQRKTMRTGQQQPGI